MEKIKIGFIGPGKVAVNLARYFTHNNLSVCGFYGHNYDSTLEASVLTDTKNYNSISELIHENNILFITTPDDIISKIDKDISKYDLLGKSVCHCSGSLSSDVLCNAKHAGAEIYSIHPMFAFSSKMIPIKDLKKIWFSIEGDNLLCDGNHKSKVKLLMEVIKNNFFLRDPMLSAEYHLASVMVSNFVLSLINIGVKYMMKCGLNENESLEALTPLIMYNFNSILNKGFESSLTGPVVRNDIATIIKHKNVLDEKDKNLYNTLSLNLLNIMLGKSSNENNKYEKMIAILKE